MENKKFRELPAIPSGQATDKLIKGAVVVEGGAFRGVYSEGVLDALMLNDINLECAIGVSAGALNGMCYLSGDIGRAIRMMLKYCKDPRYAGILPYFTDRGVIGFDFIFYTTTKSLKFNYERFFDPARKFACVATNCNTGEAEVLEKGKCSDIFQAIRASASMPYFSKPVELDGTPYLDGGCSWNDPWQWAKERYDKVLMIRNRPWGFRCTHRKDNLAGWYSKDYPKLTEVLSKNNEMYTKECIECEEAATKGDILLLCPSTEETVDRLERDKERLELFYWLGFFDTMERMDEIIDYLYS